MNHHLLDLARVTPGFMPETRVWLRQMLLSQHPAGTGSRSAATVASRPYSSGTRLSSEKPFYIRSTTVDPKNTRRAKSGTIRFSSIGMAGSIHSRTS